MSNTPPRDGFTVLDRLKEARDSHDFSVVTWHLLNDAVVELEGAQLLIRSMTDATLRATAQLTALQSELLTVLRCLDECRARSAAPGGHRSKTGEKL